jgi:hypothetical protein
MKKPVILFSILILLTSQKAFSQDNFETKLLKQFHSIQSQEMMTWIEKLCSPEFYGRPRSDGVIFSLAGYRTMDIGTTGW